ncbi:MAG: 16S rRNA (cytidine(1402)-2'-O)-methyltransferase [Solitalea-like symbiont of Tyrophagus putrescentiae]
MLINPILYVIPTPIGNLKDITLRAIETLKDVNLIIAEDTRTSKNLLLHYEIQKSLISYHKYNEHKIIGSLIEKIKLYEKVGLISDAGTPGISDAGFLLINKCINEGITVQTLPGANAFVPALINSGLPANRFIFEGFLPVKKHRQKRLLILSKESRSIILYESPHKLIKTLKDCQSFFGADRLCSISREISKIFEETKRGTIEELTDFFTTKPPKGEFVICIKGLDKENLKHENNKENIDY